MFAHDDTSDDNLPSVYASTWHRKGSKHQLTHLPLDKMAADDVFRGIFLNEKFGISIRISLTFAPKGPIDNKSVLVQVIAWRRIGDKPLPDPMLTQFTDAYVWH